MTAEDVDQLRPSGALFRGPDIELSEVAKNELLLAALPGATIERYAGVRVVRFRDQILLKKQITHLGRPWPGFKKRIQIPKSWLEVEQRARADGLVPRFVGIYHCGEVTVFTDFDPATYVQRKANNSAAHVSTNDLYQGLTAGQFARTDRNGNRLTSLRADEFAAYLQEGYEARDPRLDVFEKFNCEFLDAQQIDALPAVREMYMASWPDRFQGEWPGFYVEYRLDKFIRAHSLDQSVKLQKVKRRDQFDFDLAFLRAGKLEYLGDLKASNVTKHEAPGNDAKDIARSVEEFGRFWYVIYEHETRHARDNGDLATIEWNEYRRSVGHKGRKEYNPLSYARKFKESVRFVGMKILEVNEANFGLVLGEFAQGKQPNGAARALKVMINKRNIDNFLIYSVSIAA
ncbi:hypothetical protein ASE12_04350 [Aeromicrobium sp. Root236]|uniref:hypothetical protein n=1 Tax=Aeromicrobium sp. Root236 TaxID=1736498 RepID=UPI0006F4F56A|nr:hypothetical protein [Aeromicrobium sp. Root236]KRC64058.1 hypothetical protein ASE12_04350 [Aeromicrobium sp. Root236]